MSRKRTPDRRAPADAAPRSLARRIPSWRIAALVLVVAIAAAYANSVSVPFVFDDLQGIVENPTLRTLWPLSVPLQPPTDGSTVTNRPLLNLSLALNYAIGGLSVEGFHLVNILIHTAAALLMFGCVRRSLDRSQAPLDLRAKAAPIALGVALVWALHPLQTESVTYVIQRAESLGGLMLVAILYCFSRATAAGEAPSRRWSALTIVLAYLGAATKETLVAAPLLVFLYDRTFVAGTFLEAWRRRSQLHLAVAGSWLLLAALMLGGVSRGDSVGWTAEVGPWRTLLTQADALGMYVRLALWPSPLAFDYGSSVSDLIRRPGDVILPGLLVLALLGATAAALIRRPSLGFVGAWFFLILAPTSSVIPVLSQMRAEHRMYLPLASIVVLAVIAAHRFLGRWAWGVVAATAVALGIATAVRNHDYRSPLALWTDTAAKVPMNPRAHYNVAHAREALGDTAGALESYETAARLAPGDLMTRINLATLLLARGRAPEALAHAEAAVQVAPQSAAAHTTLGRARIEVGDRTAALAAFREAVRLAPDDAGARRNLGLGLLSQGDRRGALEQLHTAVTLQPDVSVWVTIGEVRLHLGETAAARSAFEAALQLAPTHPMANFHLGNLHAGAADFATAVPYYERAVHGVPEAIAPRFNLGVALQSVGRTSEAVRCFEEVLRRAPGDPGAREMLETLRGR